jgi:hypothetical protein
MMPEKSGFANAKILHESYKTCSLIMSLVSDGSTVSGERQVSTDGRFNTAVHNITRLFDRISAIEDELSQSQNVLSQRAPEEIWSESSAQGDARISSEVRSVPAQIRQPRSRSVPDNVSSSRIESFRVSDETERTKFLELELERFREKTQSVTNREYPALEVISQRRRYAETKADLSVAQEEIKNLLKVNSGLRKQNKELSVDRERLNASLVRMKNRLTVLRSENTRMSETIKSMQAKISHESSSARDSVRHFEALHAGARAELTAANTELTRLRETNGKLEAQVDETTKYNKRLEEKVKTLELEREKTAADFLMLENRLSAIETNRTRGSSPKRSQGSDGSVLIQLVDQLSNAREDAIAARGEAERTAQELECVRQQFTLALQKEKQMRRRAIENECLTLLSTTATIPAKQSEDSGGSKIYLRRIRKLQETVNELNERIAQYERRELARAPVKIRMKRQQKSNLPHIANSSFTDESEEEARTGPTPTDEINFN